MQDCDKAWSCVHCSWDVGVGLNVRRIRQEFLSKFLTTYALRPIGEVGSVFRQYPHPWKVFVEDKSTPGRYLLAANCESRPAGEFHTSFAAVCLQGSHSKRLSWMQRLL